MSVRVISGAILVLGLALVAGQAPALAAGPTAVLTNVTYDPPSGPADKQCTAPLPSTSGSGSASYNATDGTSHAEWEWTVPATMTAGATAHTKVTYTRTDNAGGSAAIALKPTAEFGVNEDSQSQIIAEVPVGAPGSKTAEESYSFKPTRSFDAGEKLYMRVEIGCANYVYEYTAQASDDFVVLSQLKRKVEAQINDDAWQPAAEGMKLQKGDRVHTGFKSGVVLTFPDGSRLIVGDMAMVQLDDISRGPEGGVRVRLLLRTGEVRAEVNRSTGSSGDFQVKTPTTTASVRGTVFTVAYDGTATTVTVIESSVEVTANNGATVTVPAGMETRSTATSVAPAVAIGHGFKSGGLSSAQALARLSAKIARGLKRCRLGAVSTRLTPVRRGWNAGIVVVGAKQGIAAKPKGTARFRLAGKRVKASNPLAKRIAAGCK